VYNIAENRGFQAMLRSKLPPNLWHDWATQGLWPWVAFAGFLASCNLGFGLLLWMFALATAQMLTFLLTGCVVAEAGILAASLVWGSRSLGLRLFLQVCVATILVVLWIVGILPWLDQRTLELLVPFLLRLLPAVSLGLSAPLWVAKLFFNWRIVSSANSGKSRDKLSIRDFLVGMAVVGAALALARLGKDWQPYPEWAQWVRFGFAVAFAAAAGLFLELPVVWFAFRIRSHLHGAVAIGATMLIPWAILMTTVTAIDGRIPDGRLIAGFCLFFLSLGYTTALAFWLARASGYRLAIGDAAAQYDERHE
jgi:hypothetical protein